MQNNEAISIGKASSSTNSYWDGDIANLAVWSETLTDAQMLSVYNSGHNGNIASIQSSDLELYYTFNPYALTDADTNSTVQDRSGNNNDSTSVSGAIVLRDGTPSGTPDLITIREGLNSGKDGLGFPFRNSDSNTLRLSQKLEHLVVPYTKALSATSISDAITVECWVKFHDHPTSTYNIIASNASGGSWANGWSLAIVNSELRFTLNDYNANKAYTAITDFTKWYHIVGTYDRSLSSDNIAIYVDLVKGTSGDYTTAIGESNKNLHIGYLDSENIAVKAQTCLIDEFRIYNRVLTGFKANGTVVADTETVASGEIAKNYKHQKGKHKND